MMASSSWEVTATAGKRTLCSSSDDEWTLVHKKKKPAKTLPPASSSTTKPKRPLTKESKGPQNNRPWFACSPSENFPTAYSVVRAVEETFGIRFQVKPTVNGQFMIRPEDDESLRVLSETREIDGKRLHIVQKEAPLLRKAVICGFPQEFGLCLLSRLEEVCTPVRMKSRAGIETKQVSVFFKGEIPEYIDLGSWGRFSVRPFVPEPLRCYRCQRWGHHQRRCSLPTKCGVCSGAHDTRDCLKKHQKKEQTTACCPNCGGKHHAWNLGCPSRRAQISRMKKDRPQQHQKLEGRKEETSQEATVNPPTRKRRRRNRKPKAKPSDQPPKQKEQQRSTMKKKIQLTGNLVSRSTQVVQKTEQSVPLEETRSLMVAIATQVAVTSREDLDFAHIENWIEELFASKGLGNPTSSQGAEASIQQNQQPEHSGFHPWEVTSARFSSDGEADVDLDDISGFF